MNDMFFWDNLVNTINYNPPNGIRGIFMLTVEFCSPIESTQKDTFHPSTRVGSERRERHRERLAVASERLVHRRFRFCSNDPRFVTSLKGEGWGGRDQIFRKVCWLELMFKSHMIHFDKYPHVQ